jgi:uncharacterized membrane protein
MKTSRAEAFSDGVFAVAITLLVLDLKVPASHEVLSGLTHQWPTYLAYVESFLTIGIMWLNHHTIFNHVVRVDRPLLLLNLVLLMIVALVPFPTALLGEALAPSEHFTSGDKTTAGVFYGLVMIAMSLGFSGVWGYVVKHPGLLDEKLPEHIVRRSLPRFAIGLVAYVAATLIAFVQPLVALILYGLIATYYAFEQLPSTVPETV